MSESIRDKIESQLQDVLSATSEIQNLLEGEDWSEIDPDTLLDAAILVADEGVCLRDMVSRWHQGEKE